MNKLTKHLLPAVLLLLPALALAQGLTALPGTKISVLNNARVTVVNGNILLKASAAGYASLNVQGNSSLVSVSGAGKQTMAESYISQDSWHYVSSPLSSATADTYSYLWLLPFAENTNNWGDYIVDPNFIMIPGAGFAAWSKSGVTGNAIVIYQTPASTDPTAFNQGNIALSLSYSGINKGFNLAGNPFPCAIDLDAAAEWNRVNTGNTVYYWDESAQNYRYYTANPGGTGTAVNGGSRFVPAMQGFFVATTGASPAMTIPNAARLHNNAVFYKSPLAEINTLRIVANSKGFSDETAIRFLNGSTNTFDADFDALKMKAEILQVFTAIAGTSAEHYALNSLPSENLNNTIPVFLTVPETSEVLLYISGIEGFPAGLPVYLHDTKTGLNHNLRLENMLVVQAAKEDPSPRFYLTTGSGLGLPEEGREKIQAFYCDGLLSLNGLQEHDFPVVVNIYTVSGQLIKSFDLWQHSCHPNLPAGFYLIHLAGKDFSETVKVFNHHPTR